jgi:hypothetical protein
MSVTLSTFYICSAHTCILGDATVIFHFNTVPSTWSSKHILVSSGCAEACDAFLHGHHRNVTDIEPLGLAAHKEGVVGVEHCMSLRFLSPSRSRSCIELDCSDPMVDCMCAHSGRTTVNTLFVITHGQNPATVGWVSIYMETCLQINSP